MNKDALFTKILKSELDALIIDADSIVRENQEPEKDYYKKLLAPLPIYKCFVNYPDGHGNQGIIFSRKNELSFIQMFALCRVPLVENLVFTVVIAQSIRVID